VRLSGPACVLVLTCAFVCFAFYDEVGLQREMEELQKDSSTRAAGGVALEAATPGTPPQGQELPLAPGPVLTLPRTDATADATGYQAEVVGNGEGQKLPGTWEDGSFGSCVGWLAAAGGRKRVSPE
jgi:hypothetical protein